MRLLCLLNHHWNSCTCTRCGTARDQDHDWQDCHCRRCGRHRDSNHEWRGCVCGLCGRERHEWEQGACSRCGERCDHAPRAGVDLDSHYEATAHDVLGWRCGRCGSRVVPGNVASPPENPPRP